MRRSAASASAVSGRALPSNATRAPRPAGRRTTLPLATAAQAAPALEPARCLRHVSGGARVAKAHIARAALGVEVDIRRRGNADVMQHLLGERQAVIGERADIGVEIEGAVSGD